MQQFLGLNLGGVQLVERAINKVDSKLFLDEFLSILTLRQQDIIRKIYLEGYTYDEVANLYNISRQAANFDASKGIKKIKEHFASEMI